MQPSPLSLASTWDLVADDYTREVAPVFDQFARDALALAGVTPGMRVVDVAAGPGTLSLLALERGAVVDAIDFAPRMIDALSALLAQRETDERARLQARVGDGMALPYGDGRFDAGFSLFGLMFFPDRAAGFRELARVLRPGARCVVSSWQPMHTNVVLSAATEALVALTAPAAPEAAPSAAPPALPLGSAESCREEMAAAGFRNVAVHEPVGRAQFASAGQMIASFSRSNVMYRLHKERLGATWSEIEAELVRRMVSRFGPGPISVEMPAFLTVGER